MRGRTWPACPSPPGAGARPDAGSSPGYALHRAGQPATLTETPGPDSLGKEAKPRVCICCAASHSSLFQTRRKCLDGLVVLEGKIPPHRGEREFATKRFLLKCEVVAGPLMGILGVSIVMINQLYIVSKRGFSHKGSKLGYGTSLDWTGANQELKFSNVSK